MLVSFVLSAQTKKEKLLRTLTSLREQTNKNYELILVNDESLNQNDNLDFLHQEFLQDPHLVLVINTRAQGPSVNWNLGLELVRGEYTCFLKEGDVLTPNFVNTIAQIVKNNSQPDLIQFAQEYVGFFEKPTDNDETLLTSEKLYHLDSASVVFAYVSPLLYGKLFKTKILKNYRIKFRTTNRFDALFLYCALGHSQTFYKTAEVLSTHLKTLPRYSVFDTVNQWPHILNYFRKIGTYKELRDELNYAYIRQLAYDFLVLTSQFDNPQLYKKALRFSGIKMVGKLGANFHQNKIFLAKKDLIFTNFVNNYQSFVNAEIRKIR